MRERGRTRQERERKHTRQHRNKSVRRNSPLQTRSGIGGEAEGYGSVVGGGTVVEDHSVPGGSLAPTQVHPHIAKSLTYSRQPHGVYERVCEYLCVE